MKYQRQQYVLFSRMNCFVYCCQLYGRDGSKVWIASKCASVGVAGLGSFFHHRSNPTMEYFTFVE